MNISDGLKFQLDRFSRHRYANLDERLKDELAIHYAGLGLGKLNKDCSTCVRIALDQLNDRIRRNETIHFVGKKQKTFGELKAEAKAKGFKLSRSTNREDLESFLESNRNT